MTKHTANRVGLVGASLLIVGCSLTDQQTGQGWTGSVDTLASGRVVVSNPDRAASQSSWELREQLRLGTLDEQGPELFGGIGGISLGPAGEIYVFDDQAAEIRIFSDAGTYRGRFGGRGEGPGELSGATGLVIDPDGILWVMNWGNGRYTGYEPTTGRVHDEVRRLIGYAQFPWPGDFDDEGHLIDVGLDWGGEVAVLRLDTAFEPTDTLPLPQPNDDDRISFRRESVRIASLPEPFAPSPAWAPRPRGGIIVGEGSQYRLHRIGFDGDTSMTIDLGRERVEVTDQEADSALAFFHEMQESLGGVTPDRRPSVRAVKPAHGPLFVDDQDRTWVMGIHPAGQDPKWDVFGADGRFVGQVAIPDPPSFTRPVMHGGRLAVATQVNGFPEVVVYGLVEVDHNDVGGAT